ncbi:unnamed protein product [marine sediment metagenome]|uniref:Uncharacterized protein n=1 Tax=marine sediment metagenome TaxID=412755 RepID=X0TRC2_9ZZZZ
MKTTGKIGWVVVVLVSTIVFCLIASGSDDWTRNKVLAQEAVYEYVPASQAQIIVYWVGTVAFSLLIGAIFGVVVYGSMEEKNQ